MSGCARLSVSALGSLFNDNCEAIDKCEVTLGISNVLLCRIDGGVMKMAKGSEPALESSRLQTSMLAPEQHRGQL